MKISFARDINAFSVCLLGLSLLSALPVHAQALEEITVTAQFREQGLQDVPISVTAIDASVMNERNVVKIEDLTALVPNFTYSETGIATTFLIRGIGSGINQGFEQSVGVYVDGVHYPRAQQVRAPFLDLERVEVLRGPQSILFGKNSVAGAMNITTAKPASEFEGSLLASYETEFGESIVEGIVSGPLSERVRARVAARYRDLDGWIENATLSRDEPNREESTLRGTIEFDVSDTLQATLKVEASDFDALGRNLETENAQPNVAFPPGHPLAGLTYPQILVGAFGQDPSTLNSVQDGIRSSNGDFSYNEMRTYQLDLGWEIGNFDLTSTSAFQSLEYNELCDCDFTGAHVFNAALQEEYDQFSQEFRLTSPQEDNYDYILGAYFQSSDHTFADQIIVPANSILIPALGQPALSDTRAGRQAEVDATVISAFAQLNWHLSDTVSLQIGGRITKDDRDGMRAMTIETIAGDTLPGAQLGAVYVYAGGFGISSLNLETLAAAGDPTAQFLLGNLGDGHADGSRDKTKFSPDVKFVWDVSKSTMLYASWAKGFKSGGFDFRANNRGTYASANEAFEFDDEEGTNIELGGKFKLGDTAEINATAYFTDFEDLQISIFDGILGFNVGNAATSDVKGLEVDGRWAISDKVQLVGGFAYTDFEFTDFRNGQCYAGQPPDFPNGDCDYTGKTNTLVSEWSGNVALNFAMPVAESLELTGLLSAFYASEYQSANTHDPFGLVPSHTKINARLGIGSQDGAWEIAVLGKNLTDEIVRSFNGDVPLAFSSFGAKYNYSFFGQGRTIAVQGMLRF